MSESEIEAAAERYGRFQLYESSEAGDELRLRDTAMLATWACHRLAADRAEREERAKPIDARRLPVALGGHREVTACMRGGVELWHFAGDATSVVSIPECTTQGAMDDLIRVLKGGE